ncbi:MOSC domain-containing protein [Usitatibacter palustris]|uniref:MOSC domain-containing protein n=1 Tax=Usitatibacter palustris TaxID=2732487 RepID=A0A6M4H3T3_9PROT|nr:MOSC N-terminal beta barrel domain-containing protein [Usitatibacter palustris]QJR13942.1 putative protein YcbX [Usitatibacter palustris]
MPITLTALNIYPVKSLAGIPLTESEMTPRGLRHDRRFMVVDPAGQFFTQREHPKMATIWTEIDAEMLRLAAADSGEVELPAEPVDGDAMRVLVWNSTVDAIAPSPEADAWLTDYLGTPARLVYMPDHSRRPVSEKYAPSHIVGFADGFPFLVISEASLADLNSRLAHPVPMNRFRPNLVVSGTGAFAEDGWKRFRVGAAALEMSKPCGRCQITTTDQVTGEVTGPEPLATLGTYRNSDVFGTCFGMNAVTVSPARIRVGDTVITE